METAALCRIIAVGNWKTMGLRRLVWILVGSIVALVGSIIALFVVVMLVELFYQPAYDRSDPDYQRYAEAFDRLRVQLDQNGTTKEASLDLSQLNNGKWKTACVFGGYANPLNEMQALGANISEKDQKRMTEAGSRGFRLGQVEEFEMLIAYVDLDNNAHFIHFDHGVGPNGQHFRACTPKTEPRIVFRG